MINNIPLRLRGVLTAKLNERSNGKVALSVSIRSIWCEVFRFNDTDWISDVARYVTCNWINTGVIRYSGAIELKFHLYEIYHLFV